MKEQTGLVFSISADNRPVPGCTISREIHDGIIYFSLAADTDISAEIYPSYKLLIGVAGCAEVYTSDGAAAGIAAGDAVVTACGIPVGIRTEKGAIYTEINLRRSPNMNKNIHAGEVFALADLLPYQEGRIVNMDVVSNSKMKFVVMSFDKGTGLSEHAAPGEALIFALDGEGIIVYEGQEHRIQKGENFHFAKGGLHAVKAVTPFKMALLLTLE